MANWAWKTNSPGLWRAMVTRPLTPTVVQAAPSNQAGCHQPAASGSKPVATDNPGGSVTGRLDSGEYAIAMMQQRMEIHIRPKYRGVMGTQTLALIFLAR